MKYKETWEKVLSSGEEVKYEFSIGKKYRDIGLSCCLALGLLFGFFYFFLGVLLILFGLFYFRFLLEKSNNFAFTDKRILVHRGWILTNLVSVDYDKITDVTVKEDFLDKVLYGTGSITINTAGSSSAEIVLPLIENPYEVKKKLDSIREVKK